MPVEDIATTRMVRREIIRRRLDDSRLQVNAMHGVVYLRGEVSALDRGGVDAHEELHILSRILRSRPGIRDVVLEVNVVAH